MRPAALCLCLALFLSAAPVHAATAHRKGTSEEKKIALTFDDGPSRQNTEEILSILKEYGIHATFFVIGENAKRDPDRVRSIHQAGHEIGNHTLTHAYLSKISLEKAREEIAAAEAILQEITGEKPTLFRPPGGYYNDAVLDLVESMGYQSVLWSIDTRDWSMPKFETIASKVEKSATSGDIILFHDLEDKRLPTPKALRIIIPYLIEQGYEFVSVSEILEK